MLELKKNEDFFDADGNFDWEGYEATCPKILRSPNPHIKVKDPQHRVFCREPYAQEMYNKMIGHMEENELEKDNNKIKKTIINSIPKNYDDNNLNFYQVLFYLYA